MWVVSDIVLFLHRFVCASYASRIPFIHLAVHFILLSLNTNVALAFSHAALSTLPTLSNCRAGLHTARHQNSILTTSPNPRAVRSIPVTPSRLMGWGPWRDADWTGAVRRRFKTSQRRHCWWGGVGMGWRREGRQEKRTAANLFCRKRLPVDTARHLGQSRGH